ncbi:MAG TPA: NDP-sugar synthase [Thermoanaerobaculia bacterium]|nr:NDP-sugar synthase [Thermoanaerobaculia bacterium]
MKAMILAAGYGTRLRPITYTMPKPLVPLCNRPLIAWLVEAFLDAGVDDFVVNLHHLPEPLERMLRERYGSRADFHFSFEQDILGTGGGIRRVRPQLESEEDFFLVNGDTVQFAPYDQLRAARRGSDALAALTLRHPPEGDRYTAVYYDNGRITGFGQGTGEALMFSGSHLISSRVFRYLPEKDFSGIVDEVYMPLLANGTETLAGVVDDSLWFDVGTPQRYMTASRTLLRETVEGRLAIARGSRVRDESIVDTTARIGGTFQRSIAGARSVVQGEAVDSVIWDDCVIGGNVRLERCIVAHGVEFSGSIDLQDAMICREDAAIPMDANYERRDGVVVVRI